MAWIKMRTNLDRDPDVIRLASMLSLEEDHIVGKLHRFWSWVDDQTDNGEIDVAPTWVDRYVNAQGFCDSLVEVGWLSFTDKGLVIPNFEKHMSNTAKKRAENQRRVSEHRARNAQVIDGCYKSVTRLEVEVDKSTGTRSCDSTLLLYHHMRSEWKKRKGKQWRLSKEQTSKLLKTIDMAKDEDERQEILTLALTAMEKAKTPSYIVAVLVNPENYGPDLELIGKLTKE